MRTKGSLGKAKYIYVPVDMAIKLAGPNGCVAVSAAHYAQILGIDLDSAPRVETINLCGNATVSTPTVVSAAVPVVAATEPIPEPAKPVEPMNLEDY